MDGWMDGFTVCAVCIPSSYDACLATVVWGQMHPLAERNNTHSFHFISRRQLVFGTGQISRAGSGRARSGMGGSPPDPTRAS